MIYIAHFNGGPWDGQKRAISENQARWEIEVAVLKELPCKCFSKIEPDEILPIETVIYRLVYSDNNTLYYSL